MWEFLMIRSGERERGRLYWPFVWEEPVGGGIKRASRLSYQGVRRNPSGTTWRLPQQPEDNWQQTSADSIGDGRAILPPRVPRCDKEPHRVEITRRESRAGEPCSSLWGCISVASRFNHTVKKRSWNKKMEKERAMENKCWCDSCTSTENL